MADKDIFYNLKKFAYNRVFLPEQNIDIEDFCNFCKMHLCNTYKVPYKSPLWESYSDEDIMIEYFALKFLKDEEFKKEFKAQLQGKIVHKDQMTEDEFADWADKMESENKRELDKLKETMVETINFNPNTDG